jgi:RimJ/RimL family protein N-acetyltransferase
MQTIIFEEITDKKLTIVQEIVHSNNSYNLLENGRETRTTEELREEFLNSKTKSMFIKLDNSYIGVIDYLDENPKDGFPWLGLLMIHKDQQGKGYAKQAYAKYECELLHTGKSAVRLGVLKGNSKAKQFWESVGFTYYESKPFKDNKEVDCYQKEIMK